MSNEGGRWGECQICEIGIGLLKICVYMSIKYVLIILDRIESKIKLLLFSGWAPKFSAAPIQFQKMSSKRISWYPTKKKIGGITCRTFQIKEYLVGLSRSKSSTFWKTIKNTILKCSETTTESLSYRYCIRRALGITYGSNYDITVCIFWRD